jgi:hypothetical protein
VCKESKIYIKIKHTGAFFMAKILNKVLYDKSDAIYIKYHAIMEKHER